MRDLLDYLRRAVLASGETELTDGQLLECFVSHRDEAAVAALVRRHAQMVWSVCWRILRDHHDAEDAFQATFLVLVRKAPSIKPREMIVNWLHGVTRQTAFKARATLAKRRAREKQVQELPEPEAQSAPAVWSDIQPLLDQELSRLPDKYRVAIVMCDLEGATQQEAARQLNIPEGTLTTRLRRARSMLEKRLAWRGLAVACGSVEAFLHQNTAIASAPASAVSLTINVATSVAAGKTAAACLISANVAALTEGVVKSMLLMKLRNLVAALLMVVGAVTFTGAMLLARGQAEDRANPGGELSAPAENTVALGEADVVAKKLPNDQKESSPQGKGKEHPVVREIRGVGFSFGNKQLGPQEVPEPTVFTSAKEIWEAIRFPGFQKTIDQLDFTKDQVMIFSYRGSGNDELSFRVESDKKEPVVVFFIPYSDRPFYPELHFHIYVVPKTVKWRVEREKEDPKGKNAPKKGTDGVLRRIDLKGYKGPGAARDREPFAEPTKINNADELAKAIPDKEWQKWIAKRVDFAKEQLVFFAYSSSGTDFQAFKVAKEKNEPTVIFFRWGGFHTSDLRPHFHLFALDKKVKWRVEPNRVPR
jgi:RNA polymerase sigma factor (sigma-70 family)